MYLDKTLIQKDTCTLVFFAVLFTTAKTMKQHKCPSTDEWKRCDMYIYNGVLLSYKNGFSSVQSLSRLRLFENPWIAACQASLSITNFWSSPRLTSIKSVMPSSHLILCRPFSSCPQSLPASESFPMSQLFAWGGHNWTTELNWTPALQVESLPTELSGKPY